MENVWLLFALISAFTFASSDAFTKQALLRHNEYLVAWLRLVLSLPLLALLLLFIDFPFLDRDFYMAFLGALPLEILAIILSIKALKISPMSLTMPFLSLTLVFLIIVPSFVLGEKVSLPGAIGVLLIAAGSYTLNLREVKRGILEPFTSIRKERGSVFMIVVSLLYSFTSSFGKSAIEHSSPLFFGVTYSMALTFSLTPLALYGGRKEIRELFRSGALKAAVIPGILYAIMTISHMTAMSLTKVAYMSAVKRLSLLMAVFYGHFFFHESGIKGRLLGTALMLMGFALRFRFSDP